MLLANSRTIYLCYTKQYKLIKYKNIAKIKWKHTVFNFIWITGCIEVLLARQQRYAVLTKKQQIHKLHLAST